MISCHWRIMPELLVVEERDLHRDPVRRERHQLLAGHLEAAVAADRPGLGVGVAQRGAHRGRDREAHRAQAARADVAVRPAELRVAREPHLVLARRRRRRWRRGRSARRSARRRSPRTAGRPSSAPEPCQELPSDSRAPLGELGEVLRARRRVHRAWTSLVRPCRTFFASPTIGTSTATFLPISAGSMSAWMIRAYGA